MVTLADLFDPALLSTMVREGYVRVQQHPAAPLVIQPDRARLRRARRSRPARRGGHGDRPYLRPRGGTGLARPGHRELRPPDARQYPRGSGPRRPGGAELHAEADEQLAAIEDAYLSIVDGLSEGWSRKDFALVAARHPLRGGLFLRLDGKDCRPALWQRVRPAGDWTPSGRVLSEDTA